MPEEKTPTAGPSAYIVEIDGGQDTFGRIKGVDFKAGHGVLDAKSLLVTRPDYRTTAGGLSADGIFTLERLMEYWAKRAKVRRVTEKEAEAYRLKLDKNPTGHVEKKPAPAEEPEAEKPKRGRPKKGSKPVEVAPPHKQPKKE
jgi:hypothetical protein